MGSAIVITSASADELINLGQCRLHIKLSTKTFEYYFQIIKNLKRDLILDLNFQRMFKILQDVMDDDDLYEMKQKEQLEKRWGGYLLPPTRDQKDPEMSSLISFGSNTTETSTCQKTATNHQLRTQCVRNNNNPQTICFLIWSRHTRRSIRQHPSIRRQAGRIKPIFEHNRIVLHNVQSMQNRLSATTFQRKSPQDH